MDIKSSPTRVLSTNPDAKSESIAMMNKMRNFAEVQAECGHSKSMELLIAEARKYAEEAGIALPNLDAELMKSAYVRDARRVIMVTHLKVTGSQSRFAKSILPNALEEVTGFINKAGFKEISSLPPEIMPLTIKLEYDNLVNLLQSASDPIVNMNTEMDLAKEHASFGNYDLVDLSIERAANYAKEAGVAPPSLDAEIMKSLCLKAADKFMCEAAEKSVISPFLGPKWQMRFALRRAAESFKRAGVKEMPSLPTDGMSTDVVLAYNKLMPILNASLQEELP